MYALLMAVAAMIGITNYASCSADEDYNYYSGQELSTRAEKEMGRGVEGLLTEWYELDAGEATNTFNAQFPIIGTIEIESTVQWTYNNVVNPTNPYVHASCSLNIKNVPTVSITTPSGGILELPQYVLSCTQTTYQPHLSQTYSYIDVDHYTITCYYIEYNSNGTEASRTEIGTTSHTTY